MSRRSRGDSEKAARERCEAQEKIKRAHREVFLACGEYVDVNL